MDLDATLYDCFLGYLHKVKIQGCLSQVSDYRLIGASSYIVSLASVVSVVCSMFVF